MTTVTKTQWVLVNGIIFHEITPNGFILGIDNVRRIFFKKKYMTLHLITQGEDTSIYLLIKIQGNV